MSLSVRRPRLLSVLIVIGTLVAGILIGVFGRPLFTEQPAANSAPAPVNYSAVVALLITYKGDVVTTAPDGAVDRKPIEAESSCSGTFVNSTGTILSAAHCVNEKLAKEALETKMFFDDIMAIETDAVSPPFDEEAAPVPTADPVIENIRVIVKAMQPEGTDGRVLTQPTTVMVMAEDSYQVGNDLALLQLNGVENTPFMSVSDIMPAIGDDVTAVGMAGFDVFAAQEQDGNYDKDPAPIADTVSKMRLSFSTTFGKVNGHPIVDETGQQLLQVGADFTGGMSGGPVFNQAGEIVGVVSRGRDPGFNYANGTKAVYSFLSEHQALPEQQ